MSYTCIVLTARAGQLRRLKAQGVSTHVKVRLQQLAPSTGLGICEARVQGLGII